MEMESEMESERERNSESVRESKKEVERDIILINLYLNNSDICRDKILIN